MFTVYTFTRVLFVTLGKSETYKETIKGRAKDKWGSETEGHKTDGEVDKMDSTNIKLRSIFVCISCHLY